jgi:hypothetical protein
MKRMALGVIGGLVTMAGLVMLVAPGPGLLVLLLGLSILATEFGFARRVYKRVQLRIRSAKRRWEMTRRPSPRQPR